MTDIAYNLFKIKSEPVLTCLSKYQVWVSFDTTFELKEPYVSNYKKLLNLPENNFDINSLVNKKIYIDSNINFSKNVLKKYLKEFNVSITKDFKAADIILYDDINLKFLNISRSNKKLIIPIRRYNISTALNELQSITNRNNFISIQIKTKNQDYISVTYPKTFRDITPDETYFGICNYNITSFYELKRFTKNLELIYYVFNNINKLIPFSFLLEEMSLKNNIQTNIVDNSQLERIEKLLQSKNKDSIRIGIDLIFNLDRQVHLKDIILLYRKYIENIKFIGRVDNLLNYKEIIYLLETKAPYTFCKPDLIFWLQYFKDFPEERFKSENEKLIRKLFKNLFSDIFRVSNTFKLSLVQENIKDSIDSLLDSYFEKNQGEKK